MFDPVLLLLRLYSKLYYLVKHRLHAGNLRGFGFLSKWAWRDSILTVDGAHIVFDHRAAANYACLLGGHFNEPETHLFIHRVLDRMADSCCFVDVGANVGEMLVDFPRHPRVRKAVAFEPSARCSRIIEHSCALNDLQHVTVVTKAVGERVGHGVMPCDARSQCSTAVQMGDQASTDVEDRLEAVQVTTLDAEMPDPSGLWIVLIDVEGAELAVMRGGREFIRAVGPLVVFEYHEGTRTHFSLDDVRTELGEGYELFRLRSDGFLDHDLLRTWNCVAVPRARHFYTVVTSLITDAQPMSPSRHSVLGAAVEERR